MDRAALPRVTAPRRVHARMHAHAGRGHVRACCGLDGRGCAACAGVRCRRKQWGDGCTGMGELRVRGGSGEVWGGSGCCVLVIVVRGVAVM